MEEGGGLCDHLGLVFMWAARLLDSSGIYISPRIWWASTERPTWKLPLNEHMNLPFDNEIGIHLSYGNMNMMKVAIASISTC